MPLPLKSSENNRATTASAENISPESRAHIKDNRETSDIIHVIQQKINTSKYHYLPASLQLQADVFAQQNRSTLSQHKINHTGVPIQAQVIQRQEDYCIITAGATDNDPLLVFDRPNGSQLDEVEDFYIGEAVLVVNNEVHDDVEWSEITTEDGDNIGWIPSNQLSEQPKPNESDVGWAKSKGKLYGSKNRAPKMGHVRQGNLGDCFFLAPLAAIAGTPSGKILIKSMIESLGGRKFKVSFHDMDEAPGEGIEYVEVDDWFPHVDPQQSMIPRFLYAQAASKIEDLNIPIWVAILEKAYAAWDNDGYTGLDMENASRAIGHLTGLEPASIRWDSESEKVATETGRQLWKTDTYAQEDAEDEDESNEDDHDDVEEEHTPNLEEVKSGKEEVWEDVPAEVTNIDETALLEALILAKKKPDHSIVAESLAVTNDDSNYLNDEYKILDSHVYVIMSASGAGIQLWDTKIGILNKKLPIDIFKSLFDRVLMINVAQAPTIKAKRLKAKRKILKGRIVGGRRVVGIKRKSKVK